MAITEDEQRFLTHVADHWLATSEWPRLTRLKLELKRDGRDVEALLKGLPSELCQKVEPGSQGCTVRLTLAGLELTGPGAAEVAPCIAGVRLAAHRFIAARDEKPAVTTEDLAALSPGASTEVVRRRAALLYEEWPCGRSRTPEFACRFDTCMEIVRHASVMTAREFIDRRRGRSRGRLRAEDLEDGHRAILAWVGQAWIETSQWPRVVDAVVDLREAGDVISMLDEIPTSLLWSRNRNADDRLQLTLRGLHQAASTSIPGHAVRVLVVAARVFEETLGEERVESATVSQRAGLSLDEVVTAATFLDAEGGFGIRLQRDESSVWFQLDDRVLNWTSGCDLQGFLARTEIPTVDGEVRPPAVVWDVDLHWSGPTAGVEGSTRLALIADGELADRCGDLLHEFAASASDHRLDTLVREVGVVVEDRLRSRTGAPAGTAADALVTHAFSGEAPRLRLSEVSAEQEGAALLVRGFMRWIRNPAAHRLDPTVSLHQAVQTLVLGDYILAMIDRGASLVIEPS